jgi:hypothetical protein
MRLTLLLVFAMLAAYATWPLIARDFDYLLAFWGF